MLNNPEGSREAGTEAGQNPYSAGRTEAERNIGWRRKGPPDIRYYRKLSRLFLFPMLAGGFVAICMMALYAAFEYLEYVEATKTETYYQGGMVRAAYGNLTHDLKSLAAVMSEVPEVARAITSKDMAGARRVGARLSTLSGLGVVVIADRDGTVLTFGGEPPPENLDPTWLFEVGDMPKPSLFIRRILGCDAIFSAVTVYEAGNPIGYLLLLSELEQFTSMIRNATRLDIAMELPDGSRFVPDALRTSGPAPTLIPVDIREPHAAHAGERIFLAQTNTIYSGDFGWLTVMIALGGILVLSSGLACAWWHLRSAALLPLTQLSSAMRHVAEGGAKSQHILPDAEIISDDMTQALHVFEKQGRRIADLQARLEGIASAAADAIIATDKHWNIISTNAATAAMFASPNLSGQSLLHFVPGVVSLYSLQSPSARLQMLARRADDSVFFAEAAASTIEQGGENINLVTITDVTYRRTAESAERRMREELEMLVSDRTRDLTLSREHLRQTVSKLETERLRAEDAMRAKTQFLAVVSHEIRTPMNGVLGMARLLQDGTLEQPQRERVEAILSSGAALLSILDDILDIAKLEANRLDVEVIDFDLRRVIDNAAVLMRARAEEKKLEFRLDIDESLPRFVKGDPTRLRQVLLNILGNAVKFSEHGSIEMVVRRSAMPVGQAGEGIEITISDTGIGISSEGLSRLFSSFSQADASISRRYGGTGLGLAISLRLVELMGGQLSARSEVGRGSTFTILLPCIVGNALTAAAPELPPDVPKLRILLAEDHPVNQMVAQQFLARQGHDVIAVDDGLAALDAVKSGKFDVILMDVQMPKMDGLAATREIRRLEGPISYVPVIAMTANASPTDAAECFAAGMDEFIPKPIDPDQLSRALARIAERHGLHRTAA